MTDDARLTRKSAIRAYVRDRAMFRHLTRGAVQSLDRRVLEVAKGLEIQKHGPAIGNRQRYGPWRWVSETKIAVEVDDSCMGDIHVHERVFHVRKLWR